MCVNTACVTVYKQTMTLCSWAIFLWEAKQYILKKPSLSYIYSRGMEGTDDCVYQWGHLWKRSNKWHKYLICIFKFELGPWGKIHHTNFRYLKIRHLDKTNHLGSLYTKRNIYCIPYTLKGTSRGQFGGPKHKTNRNRAVPPTHCSVRWT